MKSGKTLTKFLTIILLGLINVVAYPCTTFVLRQQDKIVFGRNLDWITGSGLLMTIDLAQIDSLSKYPDSFICLEK